MSDLEDVIMGDSEQSFKREIPAVPIPDWSIENYKKINLTNNISEKVVNTTHGEVTRNLDIQKPANANSTPSITIIGGTIVSETPQKANSSRTGLADSGSTISSLSRFIGDIPSTPTHTLSTPVYNYSNPHSTMVAATPAPASGVNQAINSIKLQNCVSTVNVGCELRLLDIYCKTRYSEYNPQRFQGVVMKLMDPRATALIFKSGKIVCTGARNEYDSYIAARKFARIIERLGFPAKFVEFKIQNFCATADLKFPIRLEALQQAHGQFASYEPELFPGLVYRMVRPRVVLLIFVNGKIVFTGGKNRNEITEALEIIYPILRGYRIS